MKTIWLILKKELLDIVRNRRRFVMTILLGFVFFPLLSALPMVIVARRAMKTVVTSQEFPVQGMEYAPGLMDYIREQGTMVPVAAGDVESLVREKQFAAGLIVPSDFEEKIRDGESATVVVVIDGSKSVDLEGARLKVVLKNYNALVLEERLKKDNLSADYLQPVTMEERNTASGAETTGSLLGLVIPGFVIMMALGNGLAVAVGAIAGEKDRLTLEPVLFTPIKRTYLVIGKLMAVLVNILFTVIGMIISVTFAILVMMLALVVFVIQADVNTAIAEPTAAPVSLPFFEGGFAFDPLAIGLFLLSILPILLMGTSLQIMISSFARNSEEAYTYSVPLSLISMTPMLTALMLDEFNPSLWHYGIPIFGTILSMRDLLSGHVYAGSLVMMFATSLLYAVGAIALTVWMFNREEVIFRA